MKEIKECLKENLTEKELDLLNLIICMSLRHIALSNKLSYDEKGKLIDEVWALLNKLV